MCVCVCVRVRACVCVCVCGCEYAGAGVPPGMWHDCVFSVGTLRRYDSTVEGVRTKKKMQEKKKKASKKKSGDRLRFPPDVSKKAPSHPLNIFEREGCCCTV